MRGLKTYLSYPGSLCVLMSLSGLCACASYRADPLPDASVSLSPPIAEIFAQQTASIDRPYLAPVAIDLTQPLDLNAIAVIAVVASPDLKAQRARAGVADAQVFAARLLPDPTLGAGIDFLLSGPDPMDRFGADQFDLGAMPAAGPFWKVRLRRRARTARSRVGGMAGSGTGAALALRVTSLDEAAALAEQPGDRGPAGAQSAATGRGMSREDVRHDGWRRWMLRLRRALPNVISTPRDWSLPDSSVCSLRRNSASRPCPFPSLRSMPRACSISPLPSASI
jgi:hypothetical protein